MSYLFTTVPGTGTPTVRPPRLPALLGESSEEGPVKKKGKFLFCRNFRISTMYLHAIQTYFLRAKPGTTSQYIREMYHVFY